jgi:large subunit ribosomal protein L32
MAVPKKKTSPSRKGKRHAGQHHKVYGKSVMKCPTTGELTMPHRVSPSGWFKGKRIFETKADRVETEGQDTQE